MVLERGKVLEGEGMPKTTVHMVEVRKFRKVEESGRRRRDDHRFARFGVETKVVFIKATGADEARREAQLAHQADPQEVTVVGDLSTIDRHISSYHRRIAELQQYLRAATVQNRRWLARRSQLLQEIGDIG
jgi:hypothetical protein